MTHGITLTGYCARWTSGLIVEPLGTWDSTGQEQLAIESASDEWQGTLTATFWAPGAETGTDMLMTDGTCIVPPEALAAPGNGTVTLRCANAAGRRISVDLAYHSAGHAQVPGSPSEPTPDLWQQYVEQVATDADRAEQASKDAAGSADAAAKSAEAAAESAKQAAQATADISEAKGDALQAIQQAQDTGVQAIQQAHQAALDDIATDRQQALTDIEGAGYKQQSAITSSGAAALEAIGRVEQTAIGQVQQAGQSWQQQIAAAGTAELGRWAPVIWDTAPLAAEHDIYAAEGAPLRVTQQGKTQQQTTTGAQLLPPQLAQAARQNGVTFEPLADGRLHVYGTATANASVTGAPRVSLAAGAYTLDIGVEREQEKFRVCLTDAAGAPYLDVADGERARTQTLDAPVQASLLVRVYAGQTVDLALSPMLCAGESAAAWEPYTGGAPSPSPDYPQAIEGTGFNGKIVLDGSADEAWVQDGQAGKYRYCIFDGLPDAVAPDASRPATCYCNRYRIISGDGTYQGILGLALYADNIYLRDPAITSVESLRAALAENPLEIYYVSSDRSKQAYTVGISTEDDAGGYHGQALAIGSPLYGDSSVMDTVANDVPSGCDKAIVLDGSEDWTVTSTGAMQHNVDIEYNDSTAYAISSRRYLWNFRDANAQNRFALSPNALFVVDSVANTPNEFKAQLAAWAAAGTPLKIWYRSTAYTEAADLHIDTVTRRWRMHEFDGTEGWYTYGTGVAVANLVDDEAEHRPQDGMAFCTVAQYSPEQMDTTTKRNVFNTNNYSGVRWWAFNVGKTVDEWKSFLAAQAAAGTPVRVLYQLATPEEYASDPHTLPALGSLPETVKGTGQSTVEYSADTKHYIDSKLQAIAAQQLNLMIGGST